MPEISTSDLREKFLQFFEEKNHVRIAGAPLTPENDPSVLFTTAGMHPLVPYLKGKKHPSGTRLADSQLCLRTTDIDEVGDASHATVFEMLGNWSLGDYFKEDAIKFSWEFLTDKKWLGIDSQYLAVSVFAGDDNAPRDEESAEIWKSVGISEKRIAYLDAKENWWPAGGGADGPQGPDTEMFYWTGESEPPTNFDAEDDSWVEIWNDVFMQYNSQDGELSALEQKNVDTGMGLERTVMILNGFKSIYEIDTFASLMQFIDAEVKETDEASRRILADHIKAATLVLGDKHPIVPSNKDQGYVLRRIIRRAMLAARDLGITKDPATLLAEGAQIMIDQYQDAYPSLAEHQEVILSEMTKEAHKFSKTLERGLKKIEQFFGSGSKRISGHEAFELYSTFGFPIEIQKEEARKHGVEIDVAAFEKEVAEAKTKHQDLSRTAAAGKFAGGLADTSEMSIKYHTATHLLHQALRDVLGDHVFQKGSNITPERLRFDFSHPDKMTDKEKTKVENIINQKIKEDIAVKNSEMTVPEAKELGALGLFEDKYSDKVSVYQVGDYSVEICGGPHVEHTGVLDGEFKIKKEESAGAGIRRIKAVLL